MEEIKNEKGFMRREKEKKRKKEMKKKKNNKWKEIKGEDKK